MKARWRTKSVNCRKNAAEEYVRRHRIDRYVLSKLELLAYVTFGRRFIVEQIAGEEFGDDAVDLLRNIL